jgi:hypothetical protein
MRRWFLFVFALHFLLSVGLLASLISSPALSGAAAQESVADSQSPTGPTQSEDLSGTSAGQHVADVQPELPEFLDQARTALDLRPPAGGPIASRQVPLTLPPLDERRRPPRQARVFA